MKHYQRQIVLAAPPAVVYKALTTRKGLRDWWTHSCDADTNTAIGGLINFSFGRVHKTMRIDGLVPGREVRWYCIEAHLDLPGVHDKAEWVGTEIVFRLAPLDGGQATQLEFEHIGLTAALQCYTACEGGWNLFLGSLQKLVETGTGTPYIEQVAEVCSH